MRNDAEDFTDDYLHLRVRSTKGHESKKQGTHCLLTAMGNGVKG